jgi:hypothetical protein
MLKLWCLESTLYIFANRLSGLLTTLMDTSTFTPYQVNVIQKHKWIRSLCHNNPFPQFWWSQRAFLFWTKLSTRYLKQTNFLKIEKFSKIKYKTKFLLQKFSLKTSFSMCIWWKCQCNSRFYQSNLQGYRESTPLPPFSTMECRGVG